MHNLGTTVNELYAMLKSHEQTLPKKDVAPTLHAIRADRIQKNNHKNKKPQNVVKDKNKENGNPSSLMLINLRFPLYQRKRILLRTRSATNAVSQEFLDHLKEHGIIANRTRPYTPQHNCVSQRRNRTLLDMVRSMMSLTTLPRSFWDYALEFAARILNMVSTRKVEKTPCEVWHGLHHDEDDEEIDEPQSDTIPVRRSTRIGHALDRMCLYVNAEEHELGDHNEPANYKAAFSNLESDKWLAAMNVEMQSMKDNQVGDLVDLPPNDKIVGSNWLFKKKTDMDSNVHTYKAHLVAKSFAQTYGVDYEETFSPVTDIRSISILIAIVAFYDNAI
ncbi:putative retrotransposon protein [Tanacetum coccineum]